MVVFTVSPTTSVRKSPRKNLPPRNTPDSFCRRFTRQNPSLCCMGGIFLLRETYLENFMSRPSVIPAFQSTPLHKQGQELRSEQTVTPLHEQNPSTYFLRLNNSETFVELVGARPLHLLSQTVLPLKSPTGAFIASQTLTFRRKQIIRTHLLSETSSDYFCLVRVARIELTAS